LEKDVAEFERVMRGESEGYAMDKRFVRKDGAIIHAAIDVKCQRNPSGKVDLFVATIQDISDRKLAESARRESESRLRRAIESAPIPIMIHADDGKVIRISRAWTDITGYALADIPTIDAWTLLAYGEHREMVQKDIARLYDQTSAVREGEYTIRTRGGDTRIWSFMSTSLGSMDDGRRLAISMAMDMTESKQAQGRIETLLGMYATLGRCNEAIVRSDNEDDLFAQICAAATKQGGMKLAWVGMVDEQGQVKPMASAGEGRDYLEGIAISLAEGDPSGQGPTGIAIRENRPYWCQDFASDPRTQVWKERAGRFGWRSSAGLPLRRNGVTVGSFTLYSERLAIFDEETRELLTEMAADISFALDNFDREARRKRAEATLLDQYEELRRWYRAMLGREERTLELKHEVNALLRQSGQAPRYASVDGDSAAGEAPEGDKK
jgi:PAS domain S-box-containing protein